MALFGFKKDKKDEAPKASREVVIAKKSEGMSGVRTTDVSSARYILGIRVTEKATFLSETANTYAFNISSEANKRSVAQAVAKLYKVTPAKVRIINIPRKQVFVRGKWGMKVGGRKAYVSLKEGDKISIA